MSDGAGVVLGREGGGWLRRQGKHMPKCGRNRERVSVRTLVTLFMAEAMASWERTVSSFSAAPCRCERISMNLVW